METKNKKIKIIIIAIILLVFLMIMINVIPPKRSVDFNEFLVGDELPQLAAHRGGGANAPENTMKAYKKAVNEYQADIIETDVCLTKDGYLVFIHDLTLDDTSDIDMLEHGVINDDNNNHFIGNYTLKELKQYNFGYNYKDKNGNYPYRDLVSNYELNSEERIKLLDDNDLQIVELSELFDEFYESNPNLKFIIEIKNSGEDGLKAAEIMNNTLNNYPDYRENVVVGTYYSEVEEKIKEYGMLRGASLSTAAVFVITQMLKVNIFDTNDFACLQIPTYFDIEIGENFKLKIWLDKKDYINRAHRRNIAVQYWTINDEEEMRELIELGCDCIMTDDPELLRNVLNSYK